MARDTRRANQEIFKHATRAEKNIHGGVFPLTDLQAGDKVYDLIGVVVHLVATVELAEMYQTGSSAKDTIHLRLMAHGLFPKNFMATPWRNCIKLPW